MYICQLIWAFTKPILLYHCVYAYISACIFMTNKSGMTFIFVNKNWYGKPTEHPGQSSHTTGVNLSLQKVHLACWGQYVGFH